MSAPKPGPRFPTIDTGALVAQFDAVLAEPASSLAEETEQLTRAHGLLADALQGKER
ncbi:hypothetical protein M5J20_02135 [Corynebacterium sp. TA-R-1]|uniref:HNH endonuclease n=1 Tax=Corynebacterium stercoris TaxID=2943490 RepID=A0ABT1FZ13_9CORY|nr:hypothetical protein [Corynebacterium stercoris]MCP1386991.1 hypothetical protein [Corynebacterium stercoris]